MNWIKKNFINIVIGVLVILLLLQKKGNVPSEQPVIKRDTVWVIKDSTIITKPQVVKTIPYNTHSDTTIYKPDTNYGRLVAQYQSLVSELLAKNIHEDSLKIDSVGFVRVVDTVSKNVITGRSYTYKLTYPIIKETITLPEKKKTQVYIGGNIQTSSEAVSQINAGLLFKTKKDYIFGGTVGINSNGNLQYGVQSFWKISLKRN
jgi:hypothetical protein